MAADARHVFDDALLEVRDRMPLYEMAMHRTWAAPVIMPALRVDRSRVQTLVQQTGHDIVSEKQHAAISMMNHEPLFRAEQLVRDHERADRIIACPPPALRMTWASPSARPA